MTATLTPSRASNSLTAGQLPRWATPAIAAAAVVVGVLATVLLGSFNPGLAAFFAFVLTKSRSTWPRPASRASARPPTA